MNKVCFKLTYVVLGITMILSSCGNKLTILGEDSSNLQALETLKSTYERESGLEISFRPNTFEDTWEKANQDFVNKTGLYDIVMEYNFSLSSYVRNQYIWNIADLMEMADVKDISFEKDLFQNAWKEVGFYYKNPLDPENGQLQKVGYPFATNTMILVYNKRMFEKQENKQNYRKKYGEELDVPRTWKQYRQIAEFFTTDKTFGVCMQGAVGSWLYYEYCDFLYGMGASVFDKKYGWEGDKDTKITICSKEAEDATKLYLSMKKFNKGPFFTVDATEQVKLIQEGDVAMGLVWSDYLYSFISSNKSSRFGYAPIPGDKSPIAGGCFYVNKETKHPQESIRYILHIMKPETQVILTLKGLCSPFRSIYKNAEVQKTIPYAQALSESLERGTYMFEAGLESTRVSDIITNHIQRLWRGDNTDVKSILQQITIDIESARKEIYR